MTPLSHPDRPVRDLVAAADRQRRGRASFARIQAISPWVFGGALVVAAIARWVGGPAWTSWLALGTAGAGLLTVWALLRRDRDTTDAIASAVDADAGLRGELRSAHWFEAQSGRDIWAEFHLERASARAGEVDWRSLYPSVRSARSWAVTAVLAAGIVATGVRFPARRSLVHAAGIDVGAVGAELPGDLQAKLAKLMAQLDDAALDPDAKKASLADLKKLMASLDPELQKKLQAALEKKNAADSKSSSDPAKADANAAPNVTNDLPDDLKWAQENQAAKSAQADDKKPGSNNPAAPTKQGDASAASLQAQAEPGGKADAAAPIVREAASDEEGKKMMGGGGPMGGDSRPGAGKTNNNVKGAAEALLSAKALRKELLEASADALGDNVEKEDLRRKTEQGKSSLGFTHADAPRTVDPSRSAAPPPVPEPRRSLLFHYFIRR